MQRAELDVSHLRFILLDDCSCKLYKLRLEFYGQPPHDVKFKIHDVAELIFELLEYTFLQRSLHIFEVA